MTSKLCQRIELTRTLNSQVASRVAQRVKNLPAMQEMWVQSLGQEDPWRREWQPISVSLLGKSHGQRSLAGHSAQGHKQLDMTEVTEHAVRLTHSLHFITFTCHFCDLLNLIA